ncbi:hypothetical protein ACA910_011029 [Epithemia clementina (nom. ined.)]
MKIYLPAIASLALFPQPTQAWSFGPRYYGIDVWTPRMLQKQQQDLWQKQQSMLQNAFTHTSPRYEITDSDEKLQISVDVPGVKPEDIHVNFEQDGSILSIRGSRAMSSTDKSRSFKSQFSQSFLVDPTVDVEKFTVNLENGVLIILAPKDLKRIEEKIRNIPVMVGTKEEVAVHSNDENETEEKRSKTPTVLEVKTLETCAESRGKTAETAEVEEVKKEEHEMAH